MTEGSLENQVCLELQDLGERRETLVYRELQGFLAVMGCLVPLACPVEMVTMELTDPQAKRESQGSQDSQEPLVNVDWTDLLDSWGRKAIKAFLAPQGLMAHQAILELKARLAYLVFLENQDPQGMRLRKERGDTLVYQVSGGHLDRQG